VNGLRLLLGLPPHPERVEGLSTPNDDDDSGKPPSAGSEGRRPIAGGRDRVRKSLYAAALQWNPALADCVRAWKSPATPQARPYRLREKAPHLRQHRADQTTTVDPQKARRNCLKL